MADTLHNQGRTCLGSTCLKWTRDGDLSSVDLHHVLELLSSADSSVAIMGNCSLDEHPLGGSNPQHSGLQS